MSTELNMDAERAAFDEEACRKTCDICFDEVGNVWPCARKRAFARRTVDTSVDTTAPVSSPIGEDIADITLPKRWPERMADHYNTEASKQMHGTGYFKDAEIAELRMLAASYAARIRKLERELSNLKQTNT
jgi:hypothetical protein